MNEVNVKDLVVLPDGERRGVVLEVDSKKRVAKVALDGESDTAGGASPVRSFRFDELTPVPRA